MKRAIALFLSALCILLLLSSCGKRGEQESVTAPAAPAPTSTATPAPPSAPAPETVPTPAAAPTELPAEPKAESSESVSIRVPSGEYRWVDENGSTWVLSLKENGLFAVIAPDGIHNGEGWSTQSDGTVITGGTDAAGSSAIFDEFGCSVWRIIGADGCEPII